MKDLKSSIQTSKEEDAIVINAQSLTPKGMKIFRYDRNREDEIFLVHLDVSRTILNYGQWFGFIYSTAL
jgi:hypothetical protein